MSTIKTACSKILAKTISKVSTNVAYTSTKECAILLLLEEPKMPKSLLKRTK